MSEAQNVVLTRGQIAFDAACRHAMRDTPRARDILTIACRYAVEDGDKETEHCALNMIRAIDGIVLCPRQ